MKVIHLLLFCLLSVEAFGVTLENESLAISLRSEAEGMGVVGVVDKASHVRFVKGAESGADIWALLFHAHAPTGGIVEARLDNRSPALSRRIVRKGGATELIWSGLDLPGEKGVVDVTAKIALAGKSAASSWTIYVTCRSTNWALFETQYPCLRHVVDNGAADVMMPCQGLGERVYRHHVAPIVPEEFCSPTWYPMVTAYMQGGAGLYVAAHDGDSRIKSLRFLKDHDLRFETIVENAGVVGSAAEGPRYPVVLATYRGDWWQAAKLYRRWALRQKWCAKGRLIDRADYPKRMSESHAWLLAAGGPNAVSNFVRRVHEKWPNSRFAVEWTQWGNQPFDVDYPEMLPGQRGVEKTMAYGTSIGVPLMPYMNGRLWDTEQASWYYARNDGTRDEKGAFYLEHYGPKRTFGVMCPATHGWQTCFSEYVVRLCDVTQCGLVYLDQIACSRPRPCFNAAHGHPLGGGAWWTDGNRALLEKIRGALAPRNVPVTSEGSGEAWIGAVDGFLLACIPRTEDVPFYTAVYGGYATYFGSYLKRGTPFAPYYAFSARALVWGVEPGWYHGWPNEPKFRRWGDALAELARVRERAKDYLAYGSLEGEVKLTGEIGEMSLAWENPMYGTNVFTGTLPQVLATDWKNARNDRHAVALANIGPTPQTVSFTTPFADEVTLEPYSAQVIEK